MADSASPVSYYLLVKLMAYRKWHGCKKILVLFVLVICFLVARDSQSRASADKYVSLEHYIVQY